MERSFQLDRVVRRPSGPAMVGRKGSLSRCIPVRPLTQNLISLLMRRQPVRVQGAHVKRKTQNKLSSAELDQPIFKLIQLVSEGPIPRQ